MKKIAYIIIFPLAQILTILLEWLGILFALFTLRNLEKINGYFQDVDDIKDEAGNTTCQYLFNVTLIKRRSVNKFGIYHMKISENLSLNYDAKTLTWTGWILSKILRGLKDPAFTYN